MVFKRPTNGIFYVQDVCREAGIKEATLLRLEKRGKIPKASRDRNKWRVYTREQVDLIVAFAKAVYPPEEKTGDGQ